MQCTRLIQYNVVMQLLPTGSSAHRHSSTSHGAAREVKVTCVPCHSVGESSVFQYLPVVLLRDQGSGTAIV